MVVPPNELPPPPPYPNPPLTPGGQGNPPGNATPGGQGNPPATATPGGEGNPPATATPGGQGNPPATATPGGQGGQGNPPANATTGSQGNPSSTTTPGGQGNATGNTNRAVHRTGYPPTVYNTPPGWIDITVHRGHPLTNATQGTGATAGNATSGPATGTTGNATSGPATGTAGNPPALPGPSQAARQWPQLRPSPGQVRNGGRHVRDDNPRIDLGRMTGDHAWQRTPVHELNFNHFVVNAEGNRQPDMERWNVFRQLFGDLRALELWGDFIHRAMFFRVPSTLPHTERTFTRDPLEAVYVDHMARAITELPPVEDIRDVPLFNNRDSVLGRWWNAFYTRGGFLEEANTRVTLELLVPYDSPEVPYEDVDQLQLLYPRVPEWLEQYYFPNHVPVPVPPVVFYFHRLFITGNPETRAWLQRVLRYEFALLFAAVWWHDARRGGTGVVVPEETVQWLVDLLADAPIDPDTNFGEGGRQTTMGYIAARMRDVNNAARHRRNTCTFPTFPQLNESQLIWTREDGYPDNRRTGGRQVFRDPRNLREFNRGRDQYGNRPRVSRIDDLRQADRARGGQERRSQHGVDRSPARHRPRSPDGHRSILGARRREQEDPASPEPPAQRPRHTSQLPPIPPTSPRVDQNGARPEYRVYVPHGNRDYEAEPVPMNEWGFRGHSGRGEHRDYRPMPPRANPDSFSGGLAVRPERIQAVRDRLWEIEREIGPYVAPRKRNQTRYPRGRLRGAPPGLFSDGPIERNESKTRAEQRELLDELQRLEQAQEDARQRGEYVPAPGERNPEFNPWYRRGNDRDDGGTGSGFGGGLGGGLGGGGGQTTAA